MLLLTGLIFESLEDSFRRTKFGINNSKTKPYDTDFQKQTLRDGRQIQLSYL